MTDTRDFPRIAWEYANGVIAGITPACKWTVAACLRQFDDLDRAGTPAFPYRYEPELGVKVCEVLELLPHIKGRWASRTLVLEPWQIFMQMTLFSWVHDGGELDGLRRFRTDYEEVPRKNAKSTISAGRALYMLGCDREQGAECYSAATTRDQARIVFDVARAMAARSPGYQKHFGVEVLANQLFVQDTESFLRALSAEHNSLDGLNPHFANADELHAHKTRGVWDVLETATGARTQALLSAITTAGWNRAGICYEVRGYLIKILNAVLKRHPEICEARGYKIEGDAVNDETFFGCIWTLDDGDDWTDEETWAKANPNLGVSVKLDDLRRKCAKAMQTPSAVPNFLTKHLNVWINADSAWMDMRSWDKCGDAPPIEEFLGARAIGAGDLASKIDMADKVLVFRRMVDDKAHYYAYARHYIPEAVVEESENSQYQGWEMSGKLIATPGNVIDFATIKSDIHDDARRFDLAELALDPWQSEQLSQELAAEGITTVEVRQIVQHMSEPMKELEALVLSGRFHHDGDPVLAWMASNVVAHYDNKDNIYPKKERKENKIDGIVALIMALGRWITQPGPVVSVYETRGVRSL